MIARAIFGAAILGLVPSIAAATEPLTCSTDNLLAQKALVEDASIALDDCNRRAVAARQWSLCELSPEIPERMPWIRECLSERLAANVTQLDSLSDPRASDVAALNTETHRLAEMGDVLSFYFGLMRTNIGFQLETLNRPKPAGS